MRATENKDEASTKITTLCPITAENLTRNDSYLLRVQASKDSNPKYFYIFDKENLKKLERCPFTREPTYDFLKLSELNDCDFDLLKKASSPIVLKEQEDLLKTQGLENLTWQRSTFAPTWSGLHAAHPGNSPQIRRTKTNLDLLALGAAMLVIGFVPGANIFLYAIAGYYAANILFRNTINLYCSAHRKIRERSLEKINHEVKHTHQEIKDNTNALTDADISAAVTEYKKPLIKRFSFLLSFLTLGLYSRHRSKTSSAMLAKLSGDNQFTGPVAKKRLIRNYLSDEKNYGKRLFCCLTKQIDRNIEQKETKQSSASSALAAV